MKIGASCKFCKKPITLTIDDSYNAVSDPMKLIPLASCNRCSDLRVERRVLEKKIEFICMMRHLDKKLALSKFAEHRAALEKLCQQYANMIARWHNKEGMAWDDACLDQIMEQPKQWSDVVSRLWKMFDSTQIV
jgi:hypothetical protein